MSFGADGDTRALKAMKTSCQLLNTFNKDMLKLSPSSVAEVECYSKQWNSWFKVQHPTNLSYVQDPVHVAVKLKTRVTKPSVILPLGNYLVGIHHLRMVFQNFSKDQHGMRITDIDHKDKQNFEAVMHITSKSVLKLLQQIPDAKGTLQYLSVLRSIVDSYLDESITPLSRIYKAWFSVFFLRFWQQWLLQNKDFTIENNFISLNSYYCVELNAHSLISLLRTAHDKDYQFLPWLHGSQSCEQLFRTMRSMSSTFSTVINFGMLGLLRRLHRLNIQFSLETQSEHTGISYPNVQARKAKAKQHDSISKYNALNDICDNDIATEVLRAKQDALDSLKDLGIALKPDIKEEHELPEMQEDTEETSINENDLTLTDLQEEIYSEDECAEMLSEIDKLKDAKIIEKQLHETLYQNVTFSRIKSGTIPRYVQNDSTKDNSTNNKKSSKNSALVEVLYNGKKMFIHKSTAVWIFQEGEWLSSDRLIRVRESQPLNTPKTAISTTHCTSKTPEKNTVISVGDMCVFMNRDGNTKTNEWKIGKILQFAYYLERTKKARQYTGTFVKCNKDNINKIGIICSWFQKSSSTSNIHSYVLQTETVSHNFIPLNCYVCTLPTESFKSVEATTQDAVEGMVATPHSRKLTSAKAFSLSNETVINIDLLYKMSAPHSTSTNSSDSTKSDITLKQSDLTWIQHGSYRLTKHHRSLLCGNGLLEDCHMGASQFLIQKQFPEIGGLYNTLLLQKISLIKPFENSANLQIVHVSGYVGHWIVVSTIGCDKEEVNVYDSLYPSINDNTETIIACFLHTKAPNIKINMMNVAKQKGSTDCGLHAIAILTSLAFGNDPTEYIFDQDALRPHLIQCLEKGFIDCFPVEQSRRRSSKVLVQLNYNVYCSCRLPEHYDSSMTECDNCHEWYHHKCIDASVVPIHASDKWHCPDCSKQYK